VGVAQSVGGTGESATSIRTPRWRSCRKDHSSVRSAGRKHLPICRQRLWGLCPLHQLLILLLGHLLLLLRFPATFLGGPHQVVAMGGNSIPFLVLLPFRSGPHSVQLQNAALTSRHSTPNFPTTHCQPPGKPPKPIPKRNPQPVQLNLHYSGCDFAVVVVVVVMAASIRDFLLFLALPNCIPVIVVKHTKLPQCVCAICAAPSLRLRILLPCFRPRSIARRYPATGYNDFPFKNSGNSRTEAA